MAKLGRPKLTAWMTDLQQLLKHELKVPGGRIVIENTDWVNLSN